MSNIKEMQNTNSVKSLDLLNVTEQDLLAVALSAPARQVFLRAEEIGFVFQSVVVIVWNLKPLFHRSWRTFHIKLLVFRKTRLNFSTKAPHRDGVMDISVSSMASAHQMQTLPREHWQDHLVDSGLIFANIWYDVLEKDPFLLFP
jgi:hypothetical protein